MAIPTYNCPFTVSKIPELSASGISTALNRKVGLTCGEVLKLNQNAGCALYDNVAEHCLLRQFLELRQ